MKRLSPCLVAFAIFAGMASTIQPQLAFGQNVASLTFDVATIKPHVSDNPQQIRTMIMNPTHRGQFMGSDVSLKTLIQVAYGVQENQVSGGPDWVAAQRYDIQAKSDSSVDDSLAKMTDADATIAKRKMLQALLADRFHLWLKHETAQGKELELIVAKGGPKLQPSPDTNTDPGQPKMTRMMLTGGQMNFQQASMKSLTQFIGQQVHRNVVDKTGLSGKYDFTLKWTPDQAQGSDAADGPTLYTALEEQLGLKLESKTGTIERLTVDHVEKPTEN